MIALYAGDCLDVMRTLDADSIDACVCDPPYGIAFMGRKWDSPDNIAFRPETWAEVWRVLKPGAHLVAFSGTRTYHRMVCAIEDAGFEVRDQLAWMYGSGFPKSHDISKAIDKAAGAEREVLSERPAFGIGGNGCLSGHSSWATYKEYGNPVTDAAKQWQGWGTALKPAWEPIVLARKPLSERTIAANVLRHGCGGLNIDACRVDASGDKQLAEKYASAQNAGSRSNRIYGGDSRSRAGSEPHIAGRWPANVTHDGSDEVLAEFAKYGESKSSGGTPARFFYKAKAGDVDRAGSKHPTVKPVALMTWLCSLVTPPGGTVLDPFAGSGTTGAACKLRGFNAVLIEREPEYVADIKRRLGL